MWLWLWVGGGVVGVGSGVVVVVVWWWVRGLGGGGPALIRGQGAPAQRVGGPHRRARGGAHIGGMPVAAGNKALPCPLTSSPHAGELPCTRGWSGSRTADTQAREPSTCIGDS